MPKSQIIKDVVEDAVPLDRSLMRLMVLARDVKNIRLETWAKDELNGYKNDNDLPKYRKMSSLTFKYSGINGGFQVTKAALDIAFIEDKHLDVLKEVSELGSISSVLGYSSEMDVYRDVSYLGRDIYKNSQGLIRCTSVLQIIPKSFYTGIVSEVKIILVNALCELEEKYGDLDKLGIQLPRKNIYYFETKNKEINSVLFNVAVSDISGVTSEKWYSKVAWRIIIPIMTCVAGGVIAAIIIKCFGL